MATESASDRSCGHEGDGRERLAGELRALALLALDHVDPLLARWHDAASGAAPDERREGSTSGATRPCTACPVCTAVAVVRGEHPELAEWLALHAAGLLAALREALDGRPDPRAPAPAAPTSTGQPPHVQHIPVERSPARAAAPGGEPC